MYIISLILSIIACMTAFLPLYGIIFTVMLGVISIVFSIINIKSTEKKIKEISIISIIVCIFAIIISIGINLYPIFLANKLPSGEDVKFSTLSKDYPSFTTEEIVKAGNIEFNIDNYSMESNVLNVEYTITNYGENINFSVFDFYVLDESTDNICYITYDNSAEYVYNSILEKNGSISGKMKFVLNDNYNSDELYLVYKNDESNFKIKI